MKIWVFWLLWFERVWCTPTLFSIYKYCCPFGICTEVSIATGSCSGPLMLSWVHPDSGPGGESGGWFGYWVVMLKGDRQEKRKGDCSRCEGRLNQCLSFPPTGLWFFTPLCPYCFSFRSISFVLLPAFMFIFTFQVGAPFIQQTVQRPQATSLNKAKIVWKKEKKKKVIL